LSKAEPAATPRKSKVGKKKPIGHEDLLLKKLADTIAKSDELVPESFVMKEIPPKARSSVKSAPGLKGKKTAKTASAAKSRDTIEKSSDGKLNIVVADVSELDFKMEDLETANEAKKPAPKKGAKAPSKNALKPSK
jgi:hypothetical protein